MNKAVNGAVKGVKEGAIQGKVASAAAKKNEDAENCYYPSVPSSNGVPEVQRMPWGSQTREFPAPDKSLDNTAVPSDVLREHLMYRNADSLYKPQIPIY